MVRTEEQTFTHMLMGKGSILVWIWRIRGLLFIDKSRMGLGGEWDLDSKRWISAD
jgi:hypothetical protein